MSVDGVQSRSAHAPASPEGGASGIGASLPRPFGKFVLKRRLARGGMAEVFLASLSGAQGFEKELVVKLIRPELAADEGFVKRFVDEAKTCVRLTHPNIVSIFELGVETGVLYLAMELVRGATLAEVLQEGGALRPDEGAYVALEVARALDHAHRRGVVHRDVTPGNVMLDEEGAVKLLDFGIAAPAGIDALGRAGTMEIFGTPGHMPPEQIEGKPLSGAADLFALGTVVVEAWTGRPPFRRADARASKTALLEAPRLPSVDVRELAPLDELVTAMIERDPAQRVQHADDVARTLRKYLRDRNVDLDEVARGLTSRVRRSMIARDEREAGRTTAAAPMPKTMRPTPLGDASKTFATRGEVMSWSGQATRRLTADDSGELAAISDRSDAKVEPVASTRRLDPPDGTAQENTVDRAPSTPSAPTSPKAWWLVILLVAALGVGVGLFARGQPSTRTATTPSVTPSTSIALATSTSSTGSTPSTSTTTDTSSSAIVPSTSTSTAPSPSPSVAVARLVVSSSPPSRVELDGRALGTTPIATTAPLGEHRIVLRPNGLGESFERRVTLSATSGVDVHGDFNDEPTISIRRTPNK